MCKTNRGRQQTEYLSRARYKLNKNQKYKPNGNNLTSNKQHENITDRSIQGHSHYNGQLVTKPNDGH